MKINLSFLLILLIATTFITSCKKSGADQSNYFSYDGKNYKIAYAVSSGSGDYSIATFATQEDLRPAWGKLSYVSIRLRQPSLQPGTYSFEPITSSNFDKDRHFHGVTAALDIEFYLEQINETRGTFVSDPTGGSVTITSDGPKYSFDFEFNLNNKKLTGSYSGILKQMQ